jgi:hypothetical protein
VDLYLPRNFRYSIHQLETCVHMFFYLLQIVYTLYVICLSTTCVYMCFNLLKIVYDTKNSLHTCFLLRFSLLGQIHHLADFPFAEITNPPSTSADSLMLAPSCLHTLYMMYNVTMTYLYTILRGHHISPSTNQHQIRIFLWV